MCKSTNELASFWQVVDFLHQNGEIFIGSDYRIKHETSFKGRGITDKMVFMTAKPILYLSPTRVMQLYRKNGKTVGESTLPVESLKHYLEISKEYLGTKNAVRFNIQSNPAESTQSTKDYDGRPTVQQTSRVGQALCFDYNMLVENYGVNLEVDTVQDDEPDPIDIDENDQTKPY